MLDFSYYFRNFKEIKIDRPIFLLGVQGGGLTLISRMLRRNKNVVSVSGNYHYWYGADEMQNVLWPILPPELSGIKHKFPTKKKFIKPRGWLYATNYLIDDYRNDEKDATEKIKANFQKIIRWQIARHAFNPKTARFTDKSQVFTVKIAFINKLLEEAQPKFILITRNPYALCYRSVVKKGEAPELKKAAKIYGFKKALDLAAQHWANSMKYALEDGKKLKNFLVVRLEDILNEPEKKLKEICKFADLKYSPDMLPQKQDKIVLGVRSLKRNKWYPLRKNINDKYLKETKKEDIEIIAKRCAKYAERFGYHNPRK